MAISTFKRYEKKFILTEAQYQAIMPTLTGYMRLDEYCKSRQEYTIYNIYYDTEDSSIIRHSLSKPYYKEKLRLRSYSIPTSLNSKVFLELKKKIGGIVSKRRAVLKLGQAYQFLDNRTIPQTLDYISRQVLNEIAYFLNHHEVKPAVYISYDRIALFGQYDIDFRITFDRNIITRRDLLSIEKGSFGQYLLPSRYLMEVKVSGAFPIWLANLLADQQIYSTSFSKYGQEYSQSLLRENAVNKLRQAV